MSLRQKEKSTAYRQGLANLALEGLHLSAAQNKIVMQYHKGEISKAEFLKQAAEYARK